MRLMQRRGFALVYWVLAFAASIAGLIYGAKAGSNSAPSFSDGSGASAGSHLLSGLLGALLGAAAVWALFAAVWIVLWWADRRAHPEVDTTEYHSIDDFDDESDMPYSSHEDREHVESVDASGSGAVTGASGLRERN